MVFGSKAVGRDEETDTDESLELPMQGITKRTEFGVVEGTRPDGSKQSFNGEMGLEELV